MYLKITNIKYLRPVRIIKFLYKLAKAPKPYYSPLDFNYYIFLLSYLKCKLKGDFQIYEVFELGLGSSIPSEVNIKKYVSYKQISEIDNSRELSKNYFYCKEITFCAYPR